MLLFYKFLLIFSLFFLGCTSKEFQSKPDSITVMTYNVENLFDTLDDPGKSDETYLPLAQKKSYQHRTLCEAASNSWYKKECLEMDWSESVLQSKLKRVSDVILQIKQGQGPDVLILQEVENFNVVENLRQNYLQAANYKETLLIEGPDERGIDVAILSRLPLREKPLLHHFKRTFKDQKIEDSEILLKGQELREYLGESDVNFALKKTSVNLKNKNKAVDLKKKFDSTSQSKKMRPTRGILQAQFLLPDQSKLTVYAVHLPSQGGPSHFRRSGIIALSALKKKLPQDELVIAAGDFNITASEEGREKFLSQLAAKDWLVSHQLGCEGCRGTHNYRGDWSFLDVMLFSKNFKNSAWQIQNNSIRIPNKSIYQIDHNGNPARFNNGRGQKGVSDHWPLAVDLIKEGA